MSPEFQSSNRRVTPTAETHYNAEEFEYHLHDLCYNSEELAVIGDPDQAEFNLWHMLQFQRSDGFLPNQVLTKTASKLHIERWTFNNSRFSDYGQPAVLAQPIRATFDAYRAQGREDKAYDFLRRIYPKAVALYEFNDRELRFSPDCSLNIIYYPHMAGRDGDPILNTHKKFPGFLERDGTDTHWLRDIVRVPVDYAQVLQLSLNQRAVGWDIARARQNYCMVDPEFNAKYAQNLEILAGLAEELGEQQDAERYYLLSDQVQEDAKRFLWAPEAEWPTAEMRRPGAKFESAKFTRGLFLAMNGKGEHIKYENSLGNLGAIGFRNLTPEQVNALTRLALVSYNTPVPFSSVATESRYYDPNYQMKGHIHSGGVFAYQDRFVSDSFRRHGRRDDLDSYTAYLCEIVADVTAGSAKEVFLPLKPEFVHPITGEPLRYPKVSGFNMSGQVNLMEYFDHLSHLKNDPDYFRLCATIGRVVPLTRLEVDVEESVA